MYKFYSGQTKESLPTAISFDKKHSSSFRASLCDGGCEDALFRCDPPTKGKRNTGVFSFPFDVFEGLEMEIEENKKKRIFRIEVYPAPIQCNFAHADFRFFENDKEITKLKPTIIKTQFRDKIREHLNIEIPDPT